MKTLIRGGLSSLPAKNTPQAQLSLQHHKNPEIVNHETVEDQSRIYWTSVEWGKLFNKNVAIYELISVNSIIYDWRMSKRAKNVRRVVDSSDGTMQHHWRCNEEDSVEIGHVNAAVQDARESRMMERYWTQNLFKV